MKLRAAIFDWAGTIVDYGSRAPISALECIFAAARVPISTEEARASMGLAKKDHIRAILGIPRVRQAWISKYAAEPVARMQSRGLKIGTTTGYTRPMLDYLLERAAEQNFIPDSALCPDDVPAGRPFPWMCYLTAIRLQAYPLWKIVKIGDTPADVEEGRNAGMWTIGITQTGNETGCTQEEWERCSDSDRAHLLRSAEERLKYAHFTAPSVADCDPILDQIEARLACG